MPADNENPAFPPEQPAADSLLHASLNATQGEAYRELQRLDPPLAGLFWHGLMLSQRAEAPGVGYMIAHCGRELAKGVIYRVAGLVPPAGPGGTQGTTGIGANIPVVTGNDGRVDDGFGTLVAQALQLEPSHTQVREWARLSRFFNDAAHLRPEPIPHAHVVAEFQRLAWFIFGAVAPYFTTQAEIDALLRTPEPSPSDIARLHTVLARPTQRRYFFTRLEHPGWMAPLANARVFALPPRQIVSAEGQWSPVTWWEGEYLARMAHAAPGASAVLERVPPHNDNISVWDAVARAAVALPSYHAPITRLVARGLKKTPWIVLPDGARALARRGAEQRDENAFELLGCMLDVPTQEDDRDNASDGFGVRLPFLRIDDYDASRVLEEDLPSFIAFNAVTTLRVLLSRLYRLAERDNTAAMDSSFFPPSRRYCRRLDQALDEGTDARALLATAAARTSISAFTHSEEAASTAWERLEPSRPGPSEIARRIRYFALARGAPHLTGRVDELLSDPEVLSWNVPRAEVGDVLRLRFEDATPRAQRLFRYTLERGPDAREVSVMLSDPDSDEGSNAETTETDVRGVREQWQRSALYRFHNRLPSALADFASSLGVDPSITTPRDIALAEEGSWSTGAGWVRQRSPLTVDELVSMAPAEAIAFANSWRAAPERAQESFDRESQAGFANAVRDAAASALRWASEMADYICAHNLASDWLTVAVLEAFDQALKARAQNHASEKPDAESAASGGGPTGVDGAEVGAGDANATSSAKAIEAFPWTSALLLARHALRQTERVAGDEHPSQGRSAAWAAIRLVGALDEDGIAQGCADDAWALLADARRLNGTWASQGTTSASGAEGVLMAALNTMAGDVTRATFDLALLQFRIATKERDGQTNARQSGEDEQIRARLIDAIEDTLKEARANRPATAVAQGEVAPLADVDSGAGSPEVLPSSAVGALGIVGQYIPQIEYLAHEWLASHLEDLFQDMPDSRLGPVWSAYITRANFYDAVFHLLRPTYLRAASTLPAIPDNVGRGVAARPASRPRSEWSLSGALAKHCVIAVMRGQLRPGDPDTLLEQAFAKATGDERAHAYWTVYRAWTDHKGPVDPAFIDRIVALWSARILLLEGGAVREADEEADGLLWWLMTAQIPAERSLPLALRTVKISARRPERGSSALQRLSELTHSHHREAFDVAERLWERELSSARPHIQSELVKGIVTPVLNDLAPENALRRHRAVRLINTLGGKGYTELGTLL